MSQLRCLKTHALKYANSRHYLLKPSKNFNQVESIRIDYISTRLNCVFIGLSCFKFWLNLVNGWYTPLKYRFHDAI